MDDLAAVYSFVQAFTGMSPDRIYQGYNRNIVLPKSQDYCVIEIDELERRGTNIQTWTDTGTTLKRLLDFSVIIDFIGYEQQTVSDRAAALEIVARSLEARDFFKAYSLAPLYASHEYLPMVDDTNNYTHRYRVKLRLAKYEQVTLSTETAKEARLKYIVNVDVMKKETTQ